MLKPESLCVYLVGTNVNASILDDQIKNKMISKYTKLFGKYKHEVTFLMRKSSTKAYLENLLKGLIREQENDPGKSILKSLIVLEINHSLIEDEEYSQEFSNE